MSCKDLAKLCKEKLDWSRTTTYTVIKRLEERGVLRNDRSMITSIVSKDEIQRAELNEIFEKRFEGSLPAFIAAFAKQQNLSQEDVEEIRRIIERGGK
jgi:predicted transcriptional regulator